MFASKVQRLISYCSAGVVGAILGYWMAILLTVWAWPLRGCTFPNGSTGLCIVYDTHPTVRLIVPALGVILGAALGLLLVLWIEHLRHAALNRSAK